MGMISVTFKSKNTQSAKHEADNPHENLEMKRFFKKHQHYIEFHNKEARPLQSPTKCIISNCSMSPETEEPKLNPSAAILHHRYCQKARKPKEEIIQHLPSPQGDFLVVTRRTFVGIRTGPFTLRRLSFAPLMRSAHTAPTDKLLECPTPISNWSEVHAPQSFRAIS
jgi:hypothetical protein